MLKGCKDGVHKFQARYSEKFHDIINRMTSGRGIDMNDFKERVYVCDVCIKCGKTTPHQPQPQPCKLT